MALALYVTAEPGVRGRVTARGIVLDRPWARIGFDEVRAVQTHLLPFQAPPDSFAIRVQHTLGAFTIPEGQGE